jgi:predicted RNA-binding protein with PIN domain
MMDRLIVDGYNLIFHWEELRAARAKNLAAARQLLIQMLTHYQDLTGRKVTLVFDGRSVPMKSEKGGTGIQIIFSQSGESADAVIERLAARLQAHSNEAIRRTLIATNDLMEQSIVSGFGADTISAEGLRTLVLREIEGMGKTIEDLAGRNQRKFGKR